MRRALALLVVLPLALAGCFGDEAPVEPASEGNASVQIGERPEPTFTDIPDAKLGTLAPPDLNATLDAPPRLVAGEWWRVALHDPFSGETTEFVRVVARVNGDGTYVFGMPHEGWWKEAVVFHTPAFGDVGADLSYRAHDIPFLPLKFPLADGAEWETNFETQAPLKAKVAVEDATTARVTFTGPSGGGLLGALGLGGGGGDAPVIELVYDAKIHEVTYFTTSTVTYEVLEHGYGFEGYVTVPRGEDLVFLHGRIAAPVVDVGLQPTPEPIETIVVDGGFNRVSFILASGDLAPPAPGPVVVLKATAPDGTVYEQQRLPGETGFKIDFFENAAPDGEWTIEYLVAGAGYAFIEGIAYHQYDIHLPSGDIRADHSHEVVR